jgi:hypothetical protein
MEPEWDIKIKLNPSWITIAQQEGYEEEFHSSWTIKNIRSDPEITYELVSKINHRMCVLVTIADLQIIA